MQLQTCCSSSPRHRRTACSKSVGLKPCSSLMRVSRNASSWASAKTARVLSQRMGYGFFPWHWQFSILNWISTSRFDPPKKPPGMTQNLLTHWLCNDCTCLWHCLVSSRALSISNLFSKKSAARDPSACGQQVGLQIIQDSISSLSLMVSMSWTSQDTL